MQKALSSFLVILLLPISLVMTGILMFVSGISQDHSSMHGHHETLSTLECFADCYALTSSETDQQKLSPVSVFTMSTQEMSIAHLFWHFISVIDLTVLRKLDS